MCTPTLSFASHVTLICISPPDARLNPMRTRTHAHLPPAQRYIYAVDPNRRNEFGSTGEEYKKHKDGTLDPDSLGKPGITADANTPAASGRAVADAGAAAHRGKRESHEEWVARRGGKGRAVEELD